MNPPTHDGRPVDAAENMPAVAISRNFTISIPCDGAAYTICYDGQEYKASELAALRQRAEMAERLANVLRPIMAEFDSDPTSTACFGRQLIDKARATLSEYHAIQPRTERHSKNPGTSER